MALWSGRGGQDTCEAATHLQQNAACQGEPAASLCWPSSFQGNPA